MGACSVCSTRTLRPVKAAGMQVTGKAVITGPEALRGVGPKRRWPWGQGGKPRFETQRKLRKEELVFTEHLLDTLSDSQAVTTQGCCLTGSACRLGPHRECVEGVEVGACWALVFKTNPVAQGVPSNNPARAAPPAAPVIQADVLTGVPLLSFAVSPANYTCYFVLSSPEL